MARTAGAAALCLVAGILLALSSASWHRGTYVGSTGNVCSDRHPETGAVGCWDTLPIGGWPVPFLYDNGGVSVVGSLNVVDDHFVAWAFWIDVAAYASTLLLVVAGVTAARRRGQASNSTSQ